MRNGQHRAPTFDVVGALANILELIMMFLKAVASVIPIIISMFMAIGGSLIIEECQDKGKPASPLGYVLIAVGMIGVVVTPALAILWLRH